MISAKKVNLHEFSTICSNNYFPLRAKVVAGAFCPFFILFFAWVIMGAFILHAFAQGQSKTFHRNLWMSQVHVAWLWGATGIYWQGTVLQYWQG